MAYTRMYPNNMMPRGTKVREGLENDDREFKRIYSILSGGNGSGGSLSTGASTDRQRIVSCAQTFLFSSGRNANGMYEVGIKADEIPLKITFADGNDPETFAAIDRDVTINALKPNAWELPGRGIYYLYIEYVGDGLVNYGATAIPDHYMRGLPTGGTEAIPYADGTCTSYVPWVYPNRFIFDLNESRMYRYNGSAWEKKVCVFVGTVDTDVADGQTLPDIKQRGTLSPLLFADSGQLEPVGSNGINLVGKDGSAAEVHAGEFVGPLRGQATSAGSAGELEPGISLDVVGYDGRPLGSVLLKKGFATLQLDTEKWDDKQASHASTATMAAEADEALHAARATLANRALDADHAASSDKAGKALTIACQSEYDESEHAQHDWMRKIKYVPDDIKADLDPDKNRFAFLTYLNGEIRPVSANGLKFAKDFRDAFKLGYECCETWIEAKLDAYLRSKGLI